VGRTGIASDAPMKLAGVDLDVGRTTFFGSLKLRVQL
jgi:hypothetical protein